MGAPLKEGSASIMGFSVKFEGPSTLNFLVFNFSVFGFKAAHFMVILGVHSQ